jgi:UDP-N-acetylglucosamine 2-epimerase (non-hydrolysing)
MRYESYGARSHRLWHAPEASKLAPVIRELRRHPDWAVCKVCVTAQHRQMLDQVVRLFSMVPGYPSARLRTGVEHCTVTRLAL